MKRFLKDYRLHEYTEALFLLTLGIIIQVLDGSPVDVKHRWTLAWETEFPREYFSAFIQKIIKTVLSMIILVRCLTSVLYVLSGLVVAYCILRETSPKLMLPWLFISGLKSVLLTFLETLTGVYVCSSFGKIRKPCIEFVISKAIELFFAIYLWACIRSIHKDMERLEEDAREEVLLTKMVIHRVKLRRRRARSMIDESTMNRTANLNYFELKDVPNIIFDMLKTEEELSQDSLLSPGMMLASVSNMGSYDYLKTSLSLGELGFVDLNSFQVVGLDDDRHLCPYKRAMKFLKVTRDDIQKAKERTGRNSFIQNYAVPEEISWNKLDSKFSATLTRHPRQEEIFVAQLPDPEQVKEVLKGKKQRKMHQDDILSDFDVSSEDDSRGSYEEIIDLDGEEDGRDDESVTISGETDGDTTPDLWFMTNRKDEVNRIGLFETHTSKRADNYERLYQQDFMSVIGPEVFDKACKLVKLTSLNDANGSSSSSANKIQTPYPSTSREPDLKPTESQENKEVPKTQKAKKKIAFEDHYDSQTTMPLSIILTNFPIKLDKEISNAVYFEEGVFKSSGILLLPNSSCELSLDKCSMTTTGNEDSSSMETSPAETDNKDERFSLNHTSYPSNRQTRNSLQKRVNLFSLRYFKSIRSKLKNYRLNSSSPKRVKHKDSAVFKRDGLKLSISKPITLKSANFDSPLEEELAYPEKYERILFIRELIKRPIRDILGSYYNLRELDIKYSKHVVREIYSSDIVGRCKRKVSRNWRKSKYEKYLMMRSSLEEKQNTTDHETQVYFTEEGLRSYVSVEKVTLGSSKTEKMDSDGHNGFRSLYLFGKQDLRFEPGSPVNLNDSNNPMSRSYAHTPEPDLAEREKQHNSAVKKGNDGSCGLDLFPESQLRSNKTDCFCPPRKNTPVDILPETSEPSDCSTGSDGSFFPFYSKTTDLHSPLLDKGTFIYPDYIHHSYKNVNKKGLDVEANRGLPLLIRDSVTVEPSSAEKNITSPDPEARIITRPMSLDFRGTFDQSRSGDPKTSVLQSTITDQNTEHSGVNPVQIKKESLLNCSMGKKKKQKWVTKFRKNEKSRYCELRHVFTNGMVDSSSTHVNTNTGRTEIINNKVPILQSNKLNKKYFQGVRL